MACKECYSDNPRITPLLGAEECLSNHLQYICSSCGRVICIGPKGAKKARCLMPFGTLEKAKLYIKAAEIMNEGVCGIYELIYRDGAKRYRVFQEVEELKKFLKRNSKIKCRKFTPVYISKRYTPVSPNQIRHLSALEVEKYMREREQLGIID